MNSIEMYGVNKVSPVAAPQNHLGKDSAEQPFSESLAQAMEELEEHPSELNVLAEITPQGGKNGLQQHLEKPRQHL